MRVGACAFKLREVSTDGDFFGHLYDFVESAYNNRVQLLVFPEFTILELAYLFPEIKEHEFPKYMAEYANQYCDWLTRMSANSGMAIVGGSHFEKRAPGFVNASFTVWPDGSTSKTYKNKLTQYEATVWNLQPGASLHKAADPQVATLICYDSEFPEAARLVCEAGAEVLAIPAFTETRHGFNRVRWCGHARTIENQIFVAHASLLGSLGREPVPQTFGNAAILSPPHDPFPLSGMLAETPLNEEGLAIAELDFDLLQKVREEGDVRNWNDRDSANWKLSD